LVFFAAAPVAAVTKAVDVFAVLVAVAPVAAVR
jgi:hypothetical protein